MKHEMTVGGFWLLIRLVHTVLYRLHILCFQIEEADPDQAIEYLQKAFDIAKNGRFISYSF